MSHFAKIENGIVAQVIVAEHDFISTGALGDPAGWLQTSYNTRGGVHYGQDGKPDGGEALRGNYAGVGYHYDSTHDVFYPPKPVSQFGNVSFTLNTSTWTWTPNVVISTVSSISPGH